MRRPGAGIRVRRGRFGAWLRQTRAARLALTLALMALLTAFVSQGNGVAQIQVVPSLADDAAVRLGMAELGRAAAAASTGQHRLQVLGQDLTRGRALAFAGTPQDAEIQDLAARHQVAVPELASEDYSIQPLLQPEAPRVLVIGGGPLGVAYGLFALANDVRLDRPYLEQPIGLQRRADFSFRLVSDPLDPRYPAPADALRWGYNAVMTEPWPALVLYDKIDPALYSAAAAPKERAWIEERRRLAREQLQQAKALHLTVIAPGDVISLPQRALTLYKQQLTDGAPVARYCIEQPRVQALLAAALDELFTEFPELDGIMVRTGENYPLGPLAGNPPQDARCRRTADPQASLQETLQFLQREVVGRHGKLFINRAWELGGEGGHTQLAAAQRVASAVPAEGMVYSFKVSETDFWRYNRLNPNLLSPSSQPRMIEAQAVREYEGKGTFPNYTAALYAQGQPEVEQQGGLLAAHQAGTRWAWVWAKGGGWNGPHTGTELWNDANLYALSRLLWDVHADPRALAREWASLKFEEQAVLPLVRLLERSAEAVRKGLYVSCYAAKNGPWTPNLLWVRDDIIAGGERMRQLYDSCRSSQDFAGALQEKREALALVDTMAADLAEARAYISDDAQGRTLALSLEYEQSLFETLSHYLSGMFNYYRYVDSGRRDSAARNAAVTEFRALRQSWDVHTKEVTRTAGAPSPYRDAGMLATIDQAEQDIGR